MNEIKFSKVSFEQFKSDFVKVNNQRKFSEEFLNGELKEVYDDIQLPKRSTKGSAGYDFFLPYNIIIKKKESIVIPTGIRCQMPVDIVLMEFVRSGHGFKYGLQMANTVGIIDSDYFNSDNEGHIMIKLVHPGTFLKNKLAFEKGVAFCQGVFLKYYTTEDDDTRETRNGGFGSTDKR